MIKFNKIAKELGWKRCEENINVFISEDEDILTVAFPAAQGYEDFDFDDKRIDEDFVRRFIYGICCHTKFTPDKKPWVVPMLISDYFAHKNDYDNELIWAKKAMSKNSKLTPLQFSKNIREQL